MAKIYNNSGCLNELLIRINYHEKINSLEDIIDFNRKINENKREVFNKNKEKLELDLKNLKLEREGLITFLNQNKNKIALFVFFHKIIKKKRIKRISSTIDYLEQNIDFIVKKNSLNELKKIDSIKNLIEENKNLIYGATTELSVIEELKKLPDSFVVINDYKKRFRNFIRNKENGDKIFSIQIDHIVIGPTGLFIIETKNWSKKNNNNINFFPPKKQLDRLGYAFFVYLNSALKKGFLPYFNNNLVVKKISPKKILALTNKSDYNKYQYIKILNIDEIRSYIESGENEYSDQEVNDLVNFLK